MKDKRLRIALIGLICCGMSYTPQTKSIEPAMALALVGSYGAAVGLETCLSYIKGHPTPFARGCQEVRALCEVAGVAGLIVFQTRCWGRPRMDESCLDVGTNMNAYLTGVALGPALLVARARGGLVWGVVLGLKKILGYDS